MSMGAIFAVHGLTTPGILVANLFARFPNSAVAASAYLSLAVPALFFAAAYAPGFSRLERRLPFWPAGWLVVFVTLVINVLKVFDLVFVISQGAGANGRYADVLAVSLYNAFGGQRYGLASAIGVLLVLLVLPAMAFNVRRFRRDR